MATKAYIPPTGGTTTEPGLIGGKIAGPIVKPWIALSDLNNGDVAVYVGQGNADGSFAIPNVPDGSYTLTYWDEPQDYILDIQNVTVVNGESVDVGDLHALGWWTQISGYVFNDINENGKKDSGEAGLANFPVSMKKRENSLMDRGAVTVFTDSQGYYFMENAYPITQWLVEEVYSDQFKTTGVTYQADNQPDETTVLGAGVDISVLPIIGLGGRVDWGVKAYSPGDNGGIVGTVSYDTTRNELDPRFAVVEEWQPGVPDLTVDLYAPIPCGTNAGAPCSADGYEVVASGPDAGAYATGQLLNTYVTENWQRPKAAPPATWTATRSSTAPTRTCCRSARTDNCLEGPMMGVQFAPYATDQGTPNANFGATVDGNYGFGDGCFGTRRVRHGNPGLRRRVGSHGPDAGGLPGQGRDPERRQRAPDVQGHQGRGHQHLPWRPVHPAGPAAGVRRPAPHRGPRRRGHRQLPLQDSRSNGVTVDASTPIDNPDFADAGGTYYEGQQTPLCDTKLVTVSDRRSIAPTFNVFTDVPLPVRFWGLIVDDLNFSSNPKSLLYGEKMGVPFAPVGIYDYTNRLVTTVESDYNGLFDVLLPSTNRISCPTPSGVCPNLYRFVGNDPGVPGRLNPTYNPQFRTIAAEFEAFPGLLVPADLAPTQVGVSVQLPGSQVLAPVACNLNDPTGGAAATTPELFAVSRPYVNGSSAAFTVSGQGFGATKGAGQVTLDGIPVATATWNDTADQRDGDHLAVDRPGPPPAHGHQLQRPADGQRPDVLPDRRLVQPAAVRGRPGEQPQLHGGQEDRRQVVHAARHAPGGGRPRDPERARCGTGRRPGGRVPEQPQRRPALQPARRVLREPDHLQERSSSRESGPVASVPTNRQVQGTILDGSAYGGDSAVATDWVTRIDALTWAGNQNVNDGAVISLYLAEHRHKRLPDNVQRHDRAVDRRLRHPRRRPDRLPEQHQRGRRHADGPARDHRHPGRSDLRQRLRPQPPDHEQRGPEQRRRLRDDPDRDPGPAGPRHRQPERRRPHR